MTKTITLFGSAFNPPHWGHLLMVQQSFELIPQQDEVWLLPSYGHTFKEVKEEPKKRLKLAAGLIEALPVNIRDTVKVCPIEIDYQTPGETVETLELLRKERPYLTGKMGIKPDEKLKFNFLMGSDQLPRFMEWGGYEKLLKEMAFYIFPRPGHPMEPLYPGTTALTSDYLITTNLSSTLIRQRLAKGLPVNNLAVKDKISW
jgi:nicotinate-nucleotide adenylyltransferase